MVITWDVAVNNAQKGTDDGANGARNPRHHHRAVLALVAVLLLESAALVVAVVYLVVEIMVASATSMASAVGIAVIVAAAAVWVGFIALGVYRGRAWTRAAVVVVQVLVGAVALGSFQGQDARPDLGIVMLAPAALALVLLFQKPVLDWTRSIDRDPKLY
jgi:hypothetical protein